MTTGEFPWGRVDISVKFPQTSFYCLSGPQIPSNRLWLAQGNPGWEPLFHLGGPLSCCLGCVCGGVGGVGGGVGWEWGWAAWAPGLTLSPGGRWAGREP